MDQSAKTNKVEKTGSEIAGQVFGNLLMFGYGIIVLAPMGAVFGSLAGWTTGILFGNTILSVLGHLGLQDVAMWQIGATGGFLGSFLRTKTTVTSK